MKLKAQQRSIIGKKTKNIRKEGLVPGSVFGPKREATNVQVDKKELSMTYKKVGHNKFFDLEIDGESKPAKVLIKEIKIHPVTDQYLDVSFYQAAEDRKLNVEIPVIVNGEAPAVKQNLGFLITQFDAVMVHCLPKDLPSSIEIDISNLNQPGDSISLASIQLPEGVEWDSSIDTSSALVYIASFQKEEVVVAPVVEAAAEGTEGATAEGAATEGAVGAEAKAE
jgi:large subunit ribosomal protein L25